MRKNKANFPLKYIFPSGRQAISYALFHSGLGRKSRVAYPEWSSHCVISALGKLSSPVPLNEVLNFKIETEAVLIYEQWGWPFSEDVWKNLKKFLKNKIIIFDTADSAHFIKYLSENRYPLKSYYQIISLSKILNLIQGGILIFNNDYLIFNPEPESEKDIRILENNDFNLSQTLMKSILKANTLSLSTNLKKWFQNNNFYKCLEDERVLRHQNVKYILDNGLVSLPPWMLQALDNGAGPRWIPLFKNRDVKSLNKISDYFFSKFKINIPVYNFDWLGNPLNPNYKKCLAFPVHGFNKNIKIIIEELKNISGK